MKIYKLGEEIIRKKCEPVKEVTDEMRSLFEEMFQTMDEADGVGLAAPQIGRAERFFVLMADDGVRRVFVNPQIISTSQEVCEFEEGCLSLPGFSENIVRPEKITVQALNERGRPFTLEAEGFLARIIQHEYDHLDGIVYIDRGDPNYAAKVVEKMNKRAENAKRREMEKAKRAEKRAAAEK